MSTVEQDHHERTATNPEWLRIVFAAIVIVCAVTIGLAALERGKVELLLLLVGGAAFGWVCLSRPNLSIYLAMFLLYTNAPVIAKRFHGIPHPIVYCVPLLLLLPIAYRLLFRGEQIIFPRVTVWITLFLMVETVGALTSIDPPAAFQTVLTTVTEGALLFLLVVNAVRTEQVLRGVVWAFLAAGAFLGAMSAHQYLTNSYDKNYGGFAQLEGKGFGVQGERVKIIQNRAAGPLAVKNRYAQIMLMLFPLGLFLFGGERTALLRWLALAATVLIMVGWALTFSRGGAIAFGLTVIAMGGLGHLRLRHLLIVGAIAGVLLLALPQFRTRLASFQTLPALLTGKMTSANRPDGAVTGRVTEMLAAVRVYMDHPIIGVGPAMFRNYSQQYGNLGGLKALETKREAHCLYAGVAAELGTLGLIALFGGVFVTLRDLHRIRVASANSHPLLSRMATGFFFMIIVYLTTGIFEHFSFIRYFWTMMALATACVCIARRVLQEPTASEGTATCNQNTY
ncbi:MAG: O-antigen ligase family protein [Planctomycetes bacterium]|nr:O-antigen ligase family protein [Planctomycetota bacterium]